MSTPSRVVAIVVMSVVIGLAMLVVAQQVIKLRDAGEPIVILPDRNDVFIAPAPGLADAAAARPLPADAPRREQFFAGTWDADAAARSLTGNPEASATHARLMSETRDPKWASAAEQLLRERLAGSGPTDGGPVDTHCRASLCEVRMLAPQSIGNDFMAGKAAIDAFTARYQKLADGRSGFRSDPSMHIVFDGSRPGDIGVVAYFTRRTGS